MNATETVALGMTEEQGILGFPGLLESATMAESRTVPPVPVSSHRVDLGPVSITDTDKAGALSLVEAAIQERGYHSISFCEANLLSNLLRNKDLRSTVAGSYAVFADGVALMKLAKLRGMPLPERITGPGFMLSACEYGVVRGWRHFFYGGVPGVAEKLAENLKTKFPGLQVAGTYSPPFRPLTDDEEQEVKRRIESSGAQLLWVGLGSPKQEMWIAQHLGRIDVPVVLAVGAAFDFHSGNRPWAPAWVRKAGMEWTYRAVTGGKKTLLRNVRCVSTVGTFLATVAVSSWLKKL